MPSTQLSTLSLSTICMQCVDYLLHVSSFLFVLCAIGELAECYDELGNRYVIPNYCLSHPVNMQSDTGLPETVEHPEETKQESSSQSAENKQKQKKKSNKPDSRPDQDAPNRVTLKLRLSTEQELKLHFQPKDTIADVKRRVQEREGVDVSRQRLFCSGRLLMDKSTIQSCSIPKGFVVQVIVGPETQ